VGPFGPFFTAHLLRWSAPGGADPLGRCGGDLRPTTFPVNVVITVRDGLITQIDEYSDRDEALEAAGLSE
jgi:hypothetical protein